MTEQDTKSPEAGTPAPSPPASPTDKLIEQYELPDSSYDPELDAAPSPQPAADPPQPPAPSKRPRDPETGQFLPKPKHSSFLVGRAKSLGFSQEDIDSAETEELREAVHARELEKVFNQRSYGQEQAQRPAKTAPAVPATKEEPEPEFDLADDEFDPKLVKLLKSQAATIKRLEQELGGVRERDQQREHQAVLNRLDRMFNGRSDLFGKGSMASLSPDSAEYARRSAVLGHLQSLVANQRQTSLDQDFPKAVEAIFGSQPKAEPKGPTKITEEQWNDSALAKPTHRVSREPKGDRRAMLAVKDKMREKGFALDDEIGVEEAGLPD